MKKLWIILSCITFEAAAQKITTLQKEKEKLMVIDLSFMDRMTWGGYEEIGKTAQSETNGVTNTKAIVAAVRNNDGYEGRTYAAKICDTLSAGGFNDWYLPSKTETVLIADNFEKLKLDEKMTIWSSTEANGTQAVTMYFYSKAFYNVQKVDLCHLVCVRKTE